MFKLGHNAPFPIGDWNSKASKRMDLSKRKFVIRHACIQIQPPSSCCPCPFGAYGGKVEDKLLNPWRRRQAGEHRWHGSYEIREEIHAEGCLYHVHGVLFQEGAWQMLPSEVIVETVEVAFSRPTLVVRFDNVLLFTVPVIGYDAAVGVPISSE